MNTKLTALTVVVVILAASLGYVAMFPLKAPEPIVETVEVTKTVEVPKEATETITKEIPVTVEVTKTVTITETVMPISPSSPTVKPVAIFIMKEDGRTEAFLISGEKWNIEVEVKGRELPADWTYTGGYEATYTIKVYTIDSPLVPLTSRTGTFRAYPDGRTNGDVTMTIEMKTISGMYFITRETKGTLTGLETSKIIDTVILQVIETG